MTQKIKALIIDDEADICSLTALTLERMGMQCFTANTVHQAKELLGQHSFQLCITDMKLPDGNGLELINYCQKRFPAMPIAMITAYGNLELGVNALKAGAFDVVAKPLDTQRLRDLGRNALGLSHAPTQLNHLPSETGLIGRSQPIEQLKAEIGKIARTQAPVFLQGEIGCGKALIAKLIHHQSSRAEQPFVQISCQPRTNSSLEQILFCPEAPKESLLYQARSGTLFLENVDLLSDELQLKLLQVLQNKLLPTPEFNGGYTLDFRLICTSEQDLQKLVQQGRFRQDLYFRVHVIALLLPPLRQRREDIPMLVEHFCAQYSAQWGAPTLRIDNDAMAMLQSYDFPGNISELKAILQRAVTLAEQDSISLSDLRLMPTPKSEDPGIIETNNLEAYLENIERQAIMQALANCRWNKTAAATKLGISFRTMRYRCKKLGID